MGVVFPHFYEEHIMLNNSNQTTKLLVLLVASLVVFSIITGNPLLVLSAFFILALASSAVMLFLRVLRFIAVSIQAACLMSNTQSQPVKNKRVVSAVSSNVVRNPKGNYIADVPAYIRKAQNHCYPITKETLNQTTCLVSVSAS
jgi:hypothetical protein